VGTWHLAAVHDAHERKAVVSTTSHVLLLDLHADGSARIGMCRRPEFDMAGEIECAPDAMRCSTGRYTFVKRELVVVDGDGRWSGRVNFVPSGFVWFTSVLGPTVTSASFDWRSDNTCQ
jgi:hypothetical protein